MPIDKDKHLSISPQFKVLPNKKKDEIYLINLEKINSKNKIYKLVEIEKEIVVLLQQPILVTEITEVLEKKYEFSGVELQEFLSTFLEDLNDKGLLIAS